MVTLKELGPGLTAEEKQELDAAEYRMPESGQKGRTVNPLASACIGWQITAHSIGAVLRLFGQPGPSIHDMSSAIGRDKIAMVFQNPYEKRKYCVILAGEMNDATITLQSEG